MVTKNPPPWSRTYRIDPNSIPAFSVYVDRMFATKFFALRLPLNYGTERQLRDRIGKQIDWACKNGELETKNGCYKFRDLASWALSNKKLSETVSDLLIGGTGHASIALSSFQSNASGYSIPNDLKECQEALRQTNIELIQLRNEKLTLLSTVSLYEPYFIKAKEQSRKGRVAGKRGGRPAN